MKRLILLLTVMLVPALVLAAAPAAAANPQICFSDPSLPCVDGEVVQWVIACVNGEVPCLNPHGPDP